MTKLSMTYLSDMEQDEKYQPYASVLRQYVNVRFDKTEEDGVEKYIPTWTIQKSDNRRWEALRLDNFITADKIRMVLWKEITDDTLPQKRFEYKNLTKNRFVESMNKYYNDMARFADEIIGGLVNEQLTPQLLNL